jgi:hypothetical protein
MKLPISRLHRDIQVISVEVRDKLISYNTFRQFRQERQIGDKPIVRNCFSAVRDT